jgi:hypothetical protein
LLAEEGIKDRLKKLEYFVAEEEDTRASSIIIYQDHRYEETRFKKIGGKVSKKEGQGFFDSLTAFSNIKGNIDGIKFGIVGGSIPKGMPDNNHGEIIKLFNEKNIKTISNFSESLTMAQIKEGLIEHDLFDFLTESMWTYDIVLADPPWYSEFYRAFILRSSELLRDQGILMLCVLPWLTRPNAIDDRADILSFANKAGFDLTKVIPAFLQYETPRFEKASLSLAGIECSDWRVGDLYVFRRISDPIPGLVARRPADEPEWDEFRFGTLKIKLRRRSEIPGHHFSYQPVNNNNRILDSVSRRSPNRRFIDYWTSENMAYSVEGLDILRTSLRLGV